MYTGRLVFSQLMDHLPLHTFRRQVKHYQGDRYAKRFRCMDQFLCMAFAQLTYRESLRDIETCLRAHRSKLYHMGIRSNMARSTLADANDSRDWRIYADFAHSLISIARRLYADEDFGVELDTTAYALDSTTVDLCLSLFPWAHFRKTKAAVKLHTLLDMRGNIPSFIHISTGKLGDVNVLDILLPEAGAIYVMDRGYLDFKRLFTLTEFGAFFVTRAKSNTRFRRRYSQQTDKSQGVLCDQTIVLTGKNALIDYPQPLRRVKYHDEKTGKTFNFLTNNFAIPALSIAELYRQRWKVELFFKWIKQHLRIKSFYGTSDNAVKSQIWIAISVYVLVAIIKKRLKIEATLYTILQLLSITIFEKIPLDQLFTDGDKMDIQLNDGKQLNLFDDFPGH